MRLAKFGDGGSQLRAATSAPPSKPTPKHPVPTVPAKLPTKPPPEPTPKRPIQTASAPRPVPRKPPVNPPPEPISKHPAPTTSTSGSPKPSGSRAEALSGHNTPATQLDLAPNFHPSHTKQRDYLPFNKDYWEEKTIEDIFMVTLRVNTLVLWENC
jgi:hypothetical protein